jgi:hypothetical protein
VEEESPFGRGREHALSIALSVEARSERAAGSCFPSGAVFID